MIRNFSKQQEETVCITFGRSVLRNVLIYCSIMLSRVKLTNAHTVRGRPTLKNNTECFRNGLVRELKEKQRKLSRHSMTSKTHGPHRRNDKSEYQVKIVTLNSIKIRKRPCYIYYVCNRLLYKRSVHIFGKSKYIIRVKIFSVCSLHLMENSMFVKHVT